MGLLTAEQILAAEDLRYETVKVPEWGGDVRIRSLTGDELEEHDKALWAVKQTEGATIQQMARMVAWCAVDGDGARLFDVEHVEKLGRKNGRALRRIFNAAAELNILTEESAEKLRGN